MAHNFLEQLIAEWYEYRGYFIHKNALVGKRPQGGYECELDIVAFHPGEKHLVHKGGAGCPPLFIEHR